jgi:hypothetical protein
VINEVNKQMEDGMTEENPLEYCQTQKTCLNCRSLDAYAKYLIKKNKQNKTQTQLQTEENEQELQQ